MEFLDQRQQELDVKKRTKNIRHKYFYGYVLASAVVKNKKSLSLEYKTWLAGY